MKDQFGSNLTIDILSCWVEEVWEESVDALKVDVPADNNKLTLAWCLELTIKNEFNEILWKYQVLEI